MLWRDLFFMLHGVRSSKVSAKHWLSTHFNIFPPTLQTHPGSLFSAAHCILKLVPDVIYSSHHVPYIKTDRLMSLLERQHRKPRWSQCPNKDPVRLIEQCARSYAVITETNKSSWQLHQILHQADIGILYHFAALFTIFTHTVEWHMKCHSAYDRPSCSHRVKWHILSVNPRSQASFPLEKAQAPPRSHCKGTAYKLLRWVDILSIAGQ